MKKPGYCVFGLVMALHACQGPVATTIAPPSGNIESATNCTLTLATPLGNTNLPMARMTDGWFETTFWVTTGLRILLVPSVNNGSRFLLWSGHGQSLTPWPTITGGPRPFPLAFTATGDAVCTVRINPETLACTIQPETLVANLNTRSTFSLVSDSALPDSLDPALPHTRMNRIDGSTWQIILTNLIPGRPVQFAFSASMAPQELLLASSGNSGPFILDAHIPGQNSIWLRHIPLSEEAVITLSPAVPSWSLSANGKPLFGDGYDDPKYLAWRMSATNSAWGLRSVAARVTLQAWYFLVDASFSSGKATLDGKQGYACVLVFDDPALSSGYTDSLPSINGLPGISLPTGISVEYMLIMQATDPQSDLEGVPAVSTVLYGPLLAGLPFPSSGHILGALRTDTPDGYLAWGNRYEIVLPKKRSDGTPLLPSTALRISAFAWNAGTAWGDLSNISLQAPIAEAIPWGSSNSSLGEASTWLTVP
ncbi:MAG TPA: hypothetical protein PLD82_05735 [Spirochaetota bacterium]|nr:hypothetical protein [Spirochaetota bacterium]HPH03011.1 hypothetical protein [Spirochaetota bacterium]